MKRNIVWVTGSAASGKTTFISLLTKKLQIFHKVLTDAQEMLELNKLDIGHKHHTHPKGEEGFLLTSSYHFDESIRRIVDQITQEKEMFFIIEIARGVGTNAKIDLTFRRFIELIPSDVWSRSVLVYFNTPVNIRKDRNNLRRRVGFGSDIRRESFYVPSSAMEQFFLEDDFEKVKDKVDCPIVNVSNIDLTKKELRSAADFLINIL